MDYKKPALQLLIVLALMITVVGLLAIDGRPTSASPLLQLPTNTPVPLPTNTPVPPPTNTPVPPPTNTPVAPPTNTPVVPPTNTPVVPPTNTPVVPSTNTPAPPGPPKKGGGVPPGPSATPTVGGCVKSVGKDGVSLSTEPGFYQPHVQIALRGDILYVVQGPVRADSIWWWLLSTNTGVEGWGNQDDITPDPGPCAFGSSVSPSGQTPGQVPPYPVTIVPSYLFEQTLVPAIAPTPIPAIPLVQPTVQATPAQQGALPQTGDSLAWWFLAGLLAVTMIVVGFVRRRLQAQPAVGSKSLTDDETDTKEDRSS